MVTGASSGIGAAIAELLVRRGMKVVGGARTVAKLQVGIDASRPFVVCVLFGDSQKIAGQVKDN